MQKLSGFQYLYRHGSAYVVRLQVPRRLRAAVGATELKQSLGADFPAARARYHDTVALFQRQLQNIDRVERVRPSVVESRVIQQGVREFYRVMSTNLERDAFADDESTDSSRSARLLRLAGQIRTVEEAIVADATSIMSLEAAWLCEREQWNVDRSSPLFDDICRYLMRARLEFLRQQEHRLRVNFAPRDTRDPLFEPERPIESGGRTLGALVDAYRRELEGQWSPSTKKNYVVTLRALEELLGRERLLTTVDRAACRSVREVLSNLPPNYKKLPATRDLGIREAAELARERAMPRVKPATLNSYLTKLSAVFRFAVEEGWLVANPAQGLSVVDPVPASQKRDPFSIEQLNSILSTAPWRQADVAGGDRPSLYWVPLLALFTGARVGELCQLRTSDVVARDDTIIINIRASAERRLKTANSARQLPVHDELLAMGFAEYVTLRGAGGDEQLFPQERPDALGHWGSYVSEWFAQKLDVLGLSNPKLVFHSLRHNFEDALREADIHGTAIGAYLAGRTAGGVAASYGSGFSTARLVEAINRVRYPGLSLEHLTR